jgi:cation transport protein ChaC
VQQDDGSSLIEPLAALSPRRDPAALFERTMAAWDGHSDVWIFGYASLIWRPEFPSAEQRAGTVHGFHRALRMRSRINRGTPESPGLVFALVPGGCCRGMAYRLPRDDVPDQLARLWLREMPSGVYDPRWLPCRTEQGTVPALAFTLSRQSPNYVEALCDDSLVDILGKARGRYGTTLDYLLQTAAGLRACGICDAEIERQVALAHARGLVDGGAAMPQRNG